jgi:hypothetical protein
LIDGSIEALGDGRTIKTETKVPKVFPNQVISVERPDNVPQKFKAKIPVLTSQQSVEGLIVVPQLNSGEFAKSEQQTTEFIKRTSITSRNVSESVTLTGVQYTSELGGGIATVTETYPFSGPEPTVPEFGVLSDEVEDLGDGTKIRRQIKLPSITQFLEGFNDEDEPILVPESLQNLFGQDYDEELDIVIPYQQIFVNPEVKNVSTGSRRRVSPRDVSHSLVQKYDVQDVQQSLDEYYWEIPDMISVSLPNKLKSVSLLSDFSGGSSVLRR